VCFDLRAGHQITALLRAGAREHEPRVFLLKTTVPQSPCRTDIVSTPRRLRPGRGRAIVVEAAAEVIGARLHQRACGPVASMTPRTRGEFRHDDSAARQTSMRSGQRSWRGECDPAQPDYGACSPCAPRRGATCTTSATTGPRRHCPHSRPGIAGRRRSIQCKKKKGNEDIVWRGQAGGGGGGGAVFFFWHAGTIFRSRPPARSRGQNGLRTPLEISIWS